MYLDSMDKVNMKPKVKRHKKSYIRAIGNSVTGERMMSETVWQMERK